MMSNLSLFRRGPDFKSAAMAFNNENEGDKKVVDQRVVAP